MTTHPILGTLCFVAGGFCGAFFPVVFRRVKGWSYESGWLFYSLFGMVLLPFALTVAFVPDWMRVFASVSAPTFARCVGFGILWGFGGLTWGLMIRYLGVGLGLAIGCGLCSSIGTLLPPVVAGHAADLVRDVRACAVLAGVCGTLVGIVFVGAAGHRKSRELTSAQAKTAVADFDFKKGIWIALFSGVASAGMNFGLQMGGEFERAALDAGTAWQWRGLPVQLAVLGGGFLVNATYCLIMNVKHRSFSDYIPHPSSLPASPSSLIPPPSSLLPNYFFASLSGLVWGMVATFLKMGEPLMGEMRYISFAVVMAGMVMFSSLFGVLLGEWRGTSGKTRLLLATGLVVLILSFVTISVCK